MNMQTTGRPRRSLALVLVGLALFLPSHGRAEGSAEQGAKAFRACAACHSLRPDLNMTGPTLAGIWGRTAGGLKSFDRYSGALKASGITWDAKTLGEWLQNPAALVPDNWMTFAGISDAQTRSDLIAFLHAIGKPDDGVPAVNIPSAYTATPKDLKQLSPEQRVTAIRSCRDSYFVTTADGRTRPFWDESLRFETDASPFGPDPGAPAILPSGMFGDRATVIFAAPKEIGGFIRREC